MPVTSRSALEFLRRHGMIPTPSGVLPRFDTSQLRLQHIPLQQYQLDPAKMLDVLGAPPPDRGMTDPWVPVEEVTGNAT